MTEERNEVESKLRFTFGVGQVQLSHVTSPQRSNVLFGQRLKDAGEWLNRRSDRSQRQVTEIKSKLDCVQPNIDLGATPIGSAGRAPDEILSM